MAKNYIESNDAELISLVVEGDHSAFAEIVRRHTPRFFALAFRTLHNQSDAEDVVQNCFVKLWLRPQLWASDKSQFTTWFYRVVLNACTDFIRSSKKLDDVSDEQLMQNLAPVICEESRALDNEATREQAWKVELAMTRLKARQRDAINLVVYCELSQRQAAQVMGISIKALESLLIRAKRNLKKQVNLLNNIKQPENV